VPSRHSQSFQHVRAGQGIGANHRVTEDTEQKEKRRKGEKEKRRKGEKEKRRQRGQAVPFISFSPSLLFSLSLCL
jgi:hypothetical protein